MQGKLATKAKSRFFIIIGVISIITLHFSFYKVDTFPLTFAPFFIAAFFLVFYHMKIKLIGVLVAIIALGIPWMNIFQVVFIESGMEDFIKQYALWSVAVGAVVFALYGCIKQGTTSIYISKIAYWSLLIITTYSVLQVVLHSWLGVTVLYNPWGEFQYLYQFNYELFPGNIRAPGFFLEPSFNAWVILSLLLILLLKNYKVYSSIACTIIAILVINSFAGIIALFSLLTVLAFTHIKKINIKVLSIIVLTLIGVGVVSVYYARLAEVFMPGTSVHIRLVAPLMLINHVILQEGNIIGIALGQAPNIVAQFMIYEGVYMHRGIDNGLHLLFVSFGIIAFVVLISSLVFVMLNLGNRRLLLLFTYIILAIQFSGGIWAPEFVYVLCIVLFAYRTGEELQKGEFLKRKVV